MDWGSNVTYLGSTTLKERAVQFGIKDADRLRHFCVLGKSNSGRAELIVQMALQDIERGLGTVLLDASGKAAPLLIERVDESLKDKIIYLDPSSAEYPYSWNVLEDIRTLPDHTQVPMLSQLLASIYHVELSDFITYAAGLLLKNTEATLITFYGLITDHAVREKFFEKDEKGKKDFEERLASHPEVVTVLEEEGRYVAKDTLVRNLLGQSSSKFNLATLAEGKILIVDFSHIRIFPTRMTPLVRTFVDVVRALGEHNSTPVSLYMQDCLRYLSESEIERTFASKKIAISVADTIVQEDDRERREFAISRCGSIASFATHPSDKAIIERAFYPYTDSDELTQLDAGEMIMALTIDDIRARPFFAKALPLPERKHVAYQDVIIDARNAYTTPRVKVDALFKNQKGDGKDNAPPERRRGPGGFQDAFRSIMANRAQNMPLNDSANKKNTTKGEDSKEDTKKESSQKKEDTAKKEETKKNEVPEDVLKKLLYVHPVPSS